MSTILQFRPPTMPHDDILTTLNRAREWAQELSEQILQHAIEIERNEGMMLSKQGVLKCCEELIASIELELGRGG